MSSGFSPSTYGALLGLIRDTLASSGALVGLREFQARMVLLGRKVHKVKLGHKERQVQLGLKVNLDLREFQAMMVLLGRKVYGMIRLTRLS